MSRHDSGRSSTRLLARAGTRLPVWAGSRFVRRHGLWAAWLLMAAILLPPAALLRAQAPQQAALVVRYGDGSVTTHCVDLDAEPITGLELLLRSGLNVIYEGSSSFGVRVCKIGAEGCDDPRNCFCRCQGAECLYWSYWHLVEGEWQYSIVGPSSSPVEPGTVQGWSWGIGTPAGAPQPPTMSFADVCRPAAATPPPAPTLSPTPSPAPTQTPVPTETVLPTPTQAPPTRVAPTRTVPAPPSATPAATLTAVPTETAMDTPTLAVDQTNTPAASSTPVPPSPAETQAGWTNYILFGGILAILALLAGLALRPRRRP